MKRRKDNVSEQGQHRPGLRQGVRIKAKSTLGSDKSFKQMFCLEHLVERCATAGGRETRAADLREDGEFARGKGQFEVPRDLHVDSLGGIR